MKRKLLKPPSQHREILFLPDPSELSRLISPETRVCVVHQPVFFNPGVSLKFLLLDYLPSCESEMIFLDTDRITLNARIPDKEGAVSVLEFLNTREIFLNFPSPDEVKVKNFFDTIIEKLKDFQEVIRYVRFYRNIFEEGLKKYGFLKEILANSFLSYYQIERQPRFFSDFLNCKEYSEFFIEIYEKDKLFRELFNSILDEYRAEFKFRYRNYPFPRLEPEELPFWILDNGVRKRCFKKEVRLSDLKAGRILPRAITVTLFLRIYKFDLFIHGVGAANYEWVTDRLIERFFNKEVPPYIVVSGTFLLSGCKERELPFFYFDPDEIKSSVREFMKKFLAVRF
jgi:hypothetical protein